jgi:hypothetical protein
MCTCRWLLLAAAACVVFALSCPLAPVSPMAATGPTRRETRSRKVSQRMAVVDESTRQQVRCPAVLCPAVLPYLPNSSSRKQALPAPSNTIVASELRSFATCVIAHLGSIELASCQAREQLCVPELYAPLSFSRCTHPKLCYAIRAE